MNWNVYLLKPKYAKAKPSSRPWPEAWELSDLNIKTNSYVRSQQVAEKKFPGRVCHVVMDEAPMKCKSATCLCKKRGDNPKCPDHGWEENPRPKLSSSLSTSCLCKVRGDNKDCPRHGWGG